MTATVPRCSECAACCRWHGCGWRLGPSPLGTWNCNRPVPYVGERCERLLTPGSPECLDLRRRAGLDPVTT